MKYAFIACLLASQFAAGQPVPVSKLDAYMQAEEQVKEFSGTVLLVQGNKKVYDKSALYADREWLIPNSPRAKYRIGSITKQFTAALILKLEEQGKLSVNDKLSKYFPDYPKADSVTIHMMLNHTSGIPNYTSFPGVWQSLHYKYSPDSMVRLIKSRPYDFPPGKGWNYSNSAYYMLGMIIEKASGMRYANYLKEQIIYPLQMKNSDLERLDSVYASKARGYSRMGNRWIPATFMELDNAGAAGAMISTTEDLNTWIRALYGQKLLSATSTRKMLTPQQGTNGYAYGIMSDSLGKHSRIWHNGGIHGFAATLAYYPDKDMTVVVLSNNDNESSDRVATALAKIMFGENVRPPYIPKEVNIDPAILQQYAGKYKSSAGEIELVVRNNRLFRMRPGAPGIELKPESNTRFFYADMSDRFIEFVKENGNTSAYLISGGERILLVPVK